MPKPFFGEIFSLSTGIDAKAPDKYAVVIGQAGLGLPDRDYYLAAQFSGQRAAYFTYIAHILSLIGWEKPKEFAAAIITFETAICRSKLAPDRETRLREDLQSDAGCADCFVSVEQLFSRN